MQFATAGYSILTHPDGTKALLKGLNSFRVISECPVTIVLFFQMFKELLRTHVPTLIPLAVSVLSFNVRLPPGAPKAARDMYLELITCQVA